MLLSTALFFFINIRIAFVVAVGIPTSFMIGLVAADQLGYSLNMLSLLGALLALGMLVDEAIVVAENIYRHLEMGKDKMTAALDGAREMFPAVLTATATTIFAFLPILTYDRRNRCIYEDTSYYDFCSITKFTFRSIFLFTFTCKTCI